MKILCIGDPHFKANNLDIMKRITSEILTIIDEKKPDLVVNVGDTLDTHERLYLRALTDATYFLIEISKRCPLILLIGNHDRENNSDYLSPIHGFVGLKDLPNITVVDTTIWDKERNFLYVPYVAPGRFNEALSKVGYVPGEEPAPSLIFAHQEFRGCSLGIKFSTDGDYWSTEYPTVFSGHIHEYHIVQSNLIYVGTPLQQNYGESPDKALMFVTLEDDYLNVKSEHPVNKVPRPKFEIERIRLTSAPIRTVVHINIADLPNFTQHIPANLTNHLVKVVIHADATETKGLETNPYYLALKDMVDKVVTKVESNKASIAENMVNTMKQQGTLAQHQKIFSLEEIVRAMLVDDQYTSSIFENEILTA